MGANDNPATTREVITDYFDWRLNNTVVTNRLFVVVRRIASESEAAIHANPMFNFNFSTLPVNLQTLNNIKNIQREIANELFGDGLVSWSRIITFISFSAILAERIIQQQPNILPRDQIISSVIDWTTDYIDTNFQTWLENQGYWAGCLKLDRTPQRRNSIGRIASVIGIGMLTLGALYMRRT